MIGHGGRPVKAAWPGGAAIAVQFVVNYEEGGENNILHGDAASEAFLSEIVGAAPWPGQRHWNMESIYEYGSRAGFWRLHDLFCEATNSGNGLRCCDGAAALARAGCRDAGGRLGNCFPWSEMDRVQGCHRAKTEAADMAKAIAIHEAGYRLQSRVAGIPAAARSIRLIWPAETGLFDYVSDSYADDLPYWHHHKGRDQLIIPYTLDVNDMRFAIPAGFNSGDPFYTYLKDTFDVLYAEGRAGAPKMMNIGLHCRLVGRPGRAAALKRFIDYVESPQECVVCTADRYCRTLDRRHIRR